MKVMNTHYSLYITNKQTNKQTNKDQTLQLFSSFFKVYKNNGQSVCLNVKKYISFKLCYLTYSRHMLVSNENRGKVNILKTADKLQKRAIMSRKKTFSYSSRSQFCLFPLKVVFFLYYWYPTKINQYSEIKILTFKFLCYEIRRVETSRYRGVSRLREMDGR